MGIDQLVTSIGYIGIFAIIFAESGLLVGFFLPGDTLLFAVGLLAARGHLNLFIALPVMFVAAVLGVNAGYLLGKHFGERLFSREDSLIFNPGHLETSKRFYSKHGGKTVILARFTPIVRSLAPLLAGIGEMHFRRFMLFNVIGAALWVTIITMLGYFFGNVIPNIDRLILPILLGIMLVSFIPPMIRIWRDEVQRAKLAQTLRTLRQRLRRKRASD